MKRKQLALRPIRANAGIMQSYRAELNTLLREVRDEVLELVDQYKDMPPSPVALDANPFTDAIDRLLVRWIERMSSLSETIARNFVKRSADYYTGNLKRQLRKAGFTVQLQMTDTTRQALQASIGMNVGLIKSIPAQYLADVSKYVHEAMAGGFDLATLTDNLQHAYHISRNRAKLIARDQANKATGVIEQARRLELGITRAIWQHSSAAKVPRQSHVRAHGKEFNIAEGMLIDGEHILPGYKINCGCTSRSIIEL